VSNIEIDKLIAERVMGWSSDSLLFGDWNPTTNLSDAWVVVEELNLLWCDVGRENCGGVRYDCTLYDRSDLSDKVNVTADTPAKAVCLAALKFKGVKIDG
jgi:hypothetical protein